nr:hypothetical protein [Tanacetum cinerariifolium]GEW11806.1 hypothetical protein [Tanacetum cinerariifolium]
MYPRFLELIIRKQVGDLSTHTTKYPSPTLTRKVFANMRRVGKGFSGVETPLFEGMLVAQEVVKEGDADENDEEVNAGDTAKGDVTLSRRFEHLELDNIAQALEITKLKRRVKKLERRNKGRMIAEIDQDVDVILEEAKEVDKDAKDESKPAEVQDAVEVITTAKIITEVVTAASKTITAASETITDAEAQVPAATLTIAPSRVTVALRRKTKGVVIRDPQEESTTSIIIPAETKSKDKGKGILVEEPKPVKKQQRIEQDEKYARELEDELNKNIDWDEAIDHVKKMAKEDPAVKRYQVLKRKPQTEAQARKNMMLYLKNVVGFKMDYFKGMSYDDIRPIFEAKFNTNVAFLQKTKEQIEEEESRALKRLNETPVEKAAKMQKLDEEVKELKRHLQIVPNEDDDVYTEATPLARKKNQRSVHGPAKVKGWKLLESCGVQIITFTTTQLILLVERKYPLTTFTLDQMLKAVRLEVEEESEVSLELLRIMSITKEQQQAHDDAIVSREQRLSIGNCNYRLSTTFKPKEPTFQVALDVLSFTSFYQSFLISASRYAPDFINLPDQKFVDPLFEEEILAFIRELGYPGNIKSLFDVKVEILPQPWRTFGTIINKCLSGRLSLSNQKQGGEEEQRHVLSKIHQSHNQPLNVKRSINSKKKQDTYKTYYVLATGKVIPKPKYVRRSTREKTVQAPKTSSGVPDVHTYGFDDEQISWKSSDNEDDDDQDDENADNEDDDLSTFDEEERQDEEDKEAESSDLRAQTPSHFESTDDEAYDEVTQRDNDEEEKLDEEKANEEEEVNEFTSLQNLPTFGSLFKFEDKVKALEDDFSKFKQTNLFAKVVSSIPGIVDTYLAYKMNEAIKIAIQLQSDRLRDETQAENEDFINKLDENIKKIIKEQVIVQVKEQVYKILPRNEKLVNKELEAEVLTRSSNKLRHPILDIVTFERRRDDEDKDEEPSAGSNRGSKRRRARKETKSTSAPKEKTSKSTGSSKEGSKSKIRSTDKSAQAEEEVHTVKDLEELAHQEFETGFTEDHTIDEITQYPDWFQKPARPPTPDRDWNKTFFNELMDEFNLGSAPWLENKILVKLLAGPTFELMKGSCKSLVKLEYFLKEVCKATTNQLDWNNREGQQYPDDLRKPLPLIPNSLVNRESTRDVYFRNRIIAIKKLTIVEWHNYKHLEWITVRRDDDKLHTFKEGNYNRLRLQDIGSMLILLVQGKLTNLNI